MERVTGRFASLAADFKSDVSMQTILGLALKLVPFSLEEEDGSRVKRLFRRLPRWLQVTLKVLAVLIPILKEIAKLIS
jgi:hypothetical protein